MRKGFTLIELLVVIAIIAILAAILFPVFGKAREKARQTHCTNNQKQFATAVQIYTQEHEEVLPAYQTFWGDIRIDKAALRCLTVPSKENGYVFNINVAGKGLGEIRDPATNRIREADAVFLTADGQHANGTDGLLANVAYVLDDLNYRHNKQLIASFLDGHVEMADETRVTTEKWLDEPGVVYDNEPAVPNEAKTFTATSESSWTVTGGSYSPATIPDGETAEITFAASGNFVVKAQSVNNPAVSITWNVVANNTPAKLTGTLINDPADVSLWQWNSTPYPPSNAFDGNTATYIDFASAVYIGQDYNTTPKRITSIRFFPRATLESRMNGGKFQGSNNLTAWTDLYSISATPPAGWNSVTVTDTTSYRYVRYVFPASGSYGNVSEVEFWGY